MDHHRLMSSPPARRPPSPAAENLPGGIYGIETDPLSAAVVLIPVPWEATTSYGRGTARGPDAIAAASVQVDLFDVGLSALGVGDPSEAGIAMLEVDAVIADAAPRAAEHAREVIDAFDRGAPCPTDALADVNALSDLRDERVQALVREHLSAGRVVGVVGGDHSVPFGAIAAVAERHPGMGILHIDAHADLRVAYQGFTGSHASIMHNVTQRIGGVSKLVSVGVRDLSVDEHRAAAESDGRIVPFYDVELSRRMHAGERWADICAEIVAALPPEVYVSFDIDGLDPSLCPHTGTPVPGGLSFREARTLLHTLAAERVVVGFDLCEVAPAPDGDPWDANVGARVLYQLIGVAVIGRAAGRRAR